MSIENPYDPPREAAQGARPGLLLWFLLAVFNSAALGAAFGAGGGWLLGALASGYYRSVFARGDSPHFDPISVGVCLGFTQGAMLGGLVGLVVVALFVWHHSRLVRERRSP